MDRVTEEMKREVSPKIVAKLIEWTQDVSEDERTRQIYNYALTDACDFILSMAKTNPQHTLAFRAIEKDLRHTNWLPLVDQDV